MTADDLPWLLTLCERRYSARYDSKTTQAWYINLVLKNPQLYLAERTDHAFCITHIYVLPFTGKDIIADVMFLCAEEGTMWDTVRLMRSSIDWAKERNGRKWQIASDTDFDLTPLAKRVGAKFLAPRCVLDLKE